MIMLGRHNQFTMLEYWLCREALKKEVDTLEVRATKHASHMYSLSAVSMLVMVLVFIRTTSTDTSYFMLWMYTAVMALPMIACLTEAVITACLHVRMSQLERRINRPFIWDMQPKWYQ